MAATPFPLPDPSGAAIGSERFLSIWRVTVPSICSRIDKGKPQPRGCERTQRLPW